MPWDRDTHSKPRNIPFNFTIDFEPEQFHVRENEQPYLVVTLLIDRGHGQPVANYFPVYQDEAIPFMDDLLAMVRRTDWGRRFQSTLTLLK